MILRRQEKDDAEDARGQNRADEAFQKVGPQARHVTDVVADVVRDRRRVAGVVLGNVRLGFADQVGAHVGGLGVDAAADAVEHGDRRAARGRIPESVIVKLPSMPSQLAEEELIASIESCPRSLPKTI